MALKIILDNYLYDLTSFADIHPGGSKILEIFPHYSDVSIHFYMNHSKASKSLLEKFKIKKIEISDNAQLNNLKINSTIYQILKHRVKEAIPYQFASYEWYLKAMIIMGLSFYFELSSILFGFTYLKSGILGFLFALIGLCIQHDANHGAISKNSYINRCWGYSQDWIGGSSLLWKHHHLLLHHAYTNMKELDPDINTTIIRLHKLTKWNKWYSFQSLYIWFLLPLLPLNWHFGEIYDLITMTHQGKKISIASFNEVVLSLLFKLLFIIRFYCIPLYYYPHFHTISCLLTTLLIGGFYLGINFIISHNFENTYFPDDDKEEDWAIIQVHSSSTVGGRLLGFFHGGLNYQIEHHLFPKICHSHYHKLRPIVEQWCKDYHITYNYYPSLFDNIRSCYRHLKIMGDGDGEGKYNNHQL